MKESEPVMRGQFEHPITLIFEHLRDPRYLALDPMEVLKLVDVTGAIVFGKRKYVEVKWQNQKR